MTKSRTMQFSMEPFSDPNYVCVSMCVHVHVSPSSSWKLMCIPSLHHRSKIVVNKMEFD